MEPVWQPWLRLLAASAHRSRTFSLDVPRHLRFVVDLKEGGWFATAEKLLVDPLLPASTGSLLHAQFALELAEVRRRQFHFAAAAAALAVAEAEADAGRGGATLRIQLAVQRVLLDLERGLPDLASGHVAAARAAARELPEGPDASRWQGLIRFTELRLHQALARSGHALQVWRELHDSGEAGRLRASEAGARVLSQLGVRVGMTVLDDPEVQEGQRAMARTLLHEALTAGTLSADERIQARMALAAHALESGALARAEALLTAIGEQLDADSGGQHRLNLAGLELRAARLAGATDDLLAQRRTAAAAAYDDLLATWDRQPDAQHGVGPLFLLRWRRLLVELLHDQIARMPAGAAGAAALELVARTQALGSLAGALGATAPTTAEVQAALCRAGQGLLLYVPGDVESVVLAVDGSRVRLASLPVGTIALDRRRAALQQAIRELRLDPTSGRAALERQSRDLAALLLPPGIRTAVAGWHAVAVVGIETLGYLPFELLPWEGRRLGDAKAVSYLPSLPVGVWLARNRAAPDSSTQGSAWLGIATEAPCAAGGQVTSLPFTAAERRVLAEGLAGSRHELVAGVTSDAFRAAAAQHDVVQLLVHGIRDEARIDPQGLLLADGGVLWSCDLEQAMPSCIVLTACRAGSGRLRRGDDGRHVLAGAALLGGARAVLVPWLDLEFQATVDMTAALHRGLWREGLPLAEALRRARIAAAAAHPEAVDPYLLHLVGLGNAPFAPARRPSAAWPWATCGALLLAGVWTTWCMRRRRQARRTRSA